MATAIPFHSANADIPNGVHNLGADTLKIYLTNTAPNAATMTDKVDLTEITAGNGYTAGGQTVTVSSSAQSAGTYSLVGDAPILTASGGSIGPFRYAVLYNDTTAADKLLCYYDYGSAVTVLDGETFDFVEGASLLTLTL